MSLEIATARLLITCPDAPGIVAAVSSFLHSHGANITCFDQHTTDPEGGDFFMRMEFTTPYLDLGRPALEQAFADRVASRFAMRYRFAYEAEKKGLAVLVSRHDHCLMELLWLHQRGELPCELTMVVSNHPDLERACAAFDVPFHHVPNTRENREAAEARMLEILDGQADVLVLARYMQILSGTFVEAFPMRIINIHHSFLPAFAGADPYRQAYDKGVKIIGATAHYVTEDLDQGPIIEQDVARVSHRHTVSEMKTLGQSLERQVLARAVRWHLDDKVLLFGNKTVVF
jgi:formyltetrahydrofolate deformylase